MHGCLHIQRSDFLLTEGCHYVYTANIEYSTTPKVTNTIQFSFQLSCVRVLTFWNYNTVTVRLLPCTSFKSPRTGVRVVAGNPHYISTYSHA